MLQKTLSILLYPFDRLTVLGGMFFYMSILTVSVLKLTPESWNPTESDQHISPYLFLTMAIGVSSIGILTYLHDQKTKRLRK